MTAPTPAPGSRLAWIALALAVIAGIAIPVDLILHARAVTGGVGFPLDAAWVHLTFARTLAETGLFRFSPADPANTTPTAPLFMLVESVLFRVTKNGKAIGLGLSLLAHAAFLVAFAAWARRRLGGAAWAAAAVLLVALDQRLAILAASGMETSLFLLFVSLAFHERLAGRARNAALALGASIWVRPDGLILAGIFLLDAFLPVGRAPSRKRREDPPPMAAVRPSLAVFAAMLAVYLAYHWAVGQSLLPDTFAVRTALHRHSGRGEFLSSDVLPAFLLVGWVPLLPLTLLAIGREAWRLARRQSGVTRPEVGWTVALVLGYLLLLPDGGRFQRYLMPAVPAATIAALALLRSLLAHPRAAALAGRLRSWRAAPALAGIAAIALAVYAVPRTAREYAGAVRFERDHYESAGRWLAANTPPGAVVAAHEPGAIGFLSRRRVFDTGGLLDPELRPAVGTGNYPRMLEQRFARVGVTHVASMEGWLPVHNVQPVFLSGEPPEAMQIVPWVPGRSHIVLGSAWSQAMSASRAIEAGDYDAAIGMLDRAIRADSRSARLWFLLGVALGSAERPAEAERAFRRAVQLDPGWREARDGLATSLEAQGRPYDVPDVLGALPADTTRR